MDLALIQPKLELPDFKSLTKRHQAIVKTAKKIILPVEGPVVFKIETVKDQEDALTVLRDVRANIKTVEQKFKTIKDPMNAAKKAVMEWEHEVLDPMQEFERGLTLANSNFIARQREEARQKEERERRELRERQEAEAREIAKQAEEKGDIKTAVSVLSEAKAEPDKFVAPRVAPQVAKVSGITSRTSYSAKITNLEALVRHCLENPALLSMFILPNETALNTQARSQKEQFSIPGVELVIKY